MDGVKDFLIKYRGAIIGGIIALVALILNLHKVLIWILIIVAGIVIGLTLAFVNLIGIRLTGTSVNPARSIGPAILTNATGTLARSQLWVFIVGPLIGGVLAALFYKFVIVEKEVSKKRK